MGRIDSTLGHSEQMGGHFEGVFVAPPNTAFARIITAPGGNPTLRSREVRSTGTSGKAERLMWERGMACQGMRTLIQTKLCLQNRDSANSSC